MHADYYTPAPEKNAQLLERLAKLMPVDWDEYLEAVATAYEKAPAHDASAVPSYQALVAHLDKLFRRITSKFEVEYVDENPYANAEEMVEDVTQNNRLKVFTGGPEHPFFTQDQNLHFRGIFMLCYVHGHSKDM